MAAEDLDTVEDIDLIAINWRMRIESGEITPDEQLAFKAWCEQDERHADAYDRAFTIWEALGSLDRTNLEPKLFKRSGLSRIRLFLFGFLSTLQDRYRGISTAAFAGAALAIAAGVAVFNQPSDFSETTSEAPTITAFSSERGETKDIALSDGSKLTLGAATEIEVAMSSGERRIILKNGAAVFDVARDLDRPFIVKAENFTAKVIGTVFDVRSNGGVVRLSVAEGSVEVSHPIVINDAPTSMQSRRQVKTGQQVAATGSEGLMQNTTFKTDAFATWRENRLRYVGATLEELVADANRYSERQILIDPDLGGAITERATFSFEGKDVERLLSTLPILFPVDIDDNGVGAIRIIARETQD